MSSKTAISRDQVQLALEEVRHTLLCAQANIRSSLSAMHQAAGVVKSLEDAMVYLGALDADISARLTTVELCLETLPQQLSDDNIDEFLAALRPAASQALIPLSRVPTGVSLN